MFEGIVSSMATGALNSALGVRQSEYDRQQNFLLNELAAEHADARARAQWRDMYSIQAQMQQLKEAGLSPSLMYSSMPSSQGATGAQSQGTGGIQTPYTPIDLAQAQLINAEARKANAEADKLEGKNAAGEADIALKFAQAGAAKAASEYTEAQKTWQNLQNNIINDTYQDQVWKIKSEARKAADEAESAFWEGENAGLQFRFNLANYQTELDKSKQELANLIQSNELSKAECEKIANEIQTMWINALANEETAEANTANAEAYANYVEGFCENLPKQIELRGKELNVEKWRIGVGAFTETVRTIGYFLGAQQLGDGGTTTTTITQDYDRKGRPTHTRQTNTKNVRLPKIK